MCASYTIYTIYIYTLYSNSTLIDYIIPKKKNLELGYLIVSF